MENTSSSRAAIVDAITSPLGFFALCLLTVEGFLGITLIYSGLAPEHKFAGLIIGSFLFIIVVAIVGLLVWKFPENLTFGETSWLKKAEMSHDWATSDRPTTKKEIEKKKFVSNPEAHPNQHERRRR